PIVSATALESEASRAFRLSSERSTVVSSFNSGIEHRFYYANAETSNVYLLDVSRITHHASRFPSRFPDFPFSIRICFGFRYSDFGFQFTLHASRFTFHASRLTSPPPVSQKSPADSSSSATA